MVVPPVLWLSQWPQGGSSNHYIPLPVKHMFKWKLSLQFYIQCFLVYVLFYIFLAMETGVDNPASRHFEGLFYPPDKSGPKLLFHISLWCPNHSAASGCTRLVIGGVRGAFVVWHFFVFLLGCLSGVITCGCWSMGFPMSLCCC